MIGLYGRIINGELVLYPQEAEIDLEMFDLTTPTKEQYENALETVKKYEKRQDELRFVKEELSRQVQKFTDVKFKVNKNKGEVIFTGVIDRELKLAISKCSDGDVFVEDIGKLIAVLKSTNQDINDIVKLVEQKENHHGGVNFNDYIEAFMESFKPLDK